MAVRSLGATTRTRHRLQCLVVDPDRTKRAFLAEAWAYFHPGFDVVTAATGEAALQWIESIPIRVASVGSSLDPETVAMIIDAMSVNLDEGIWCLVVERSPGSEPVNLPVGPYHVLDMPDPLSLEHVLHVARAAAHLIETPSLSLDRGGRPVEAPPAGDPVVERSPHHTSTAEIVRT